MQNKTLRKFIGTKSFYAMVIALIIPMIVQQGITQFVNLLDNVMVGQLGTASMSSVAIVNQIIMIFNLAIFGGLAGVSIFGAQFYGKQDHEGFQNTFRLRMYFSLIVLVIGIVVFLLWGEPLIKLYLNEEASDAAALAETLLLAKDYLFVSLLGLIPFALVQCYSSALRDTGETFSPMVASVIAIVVNLVLNYLLIFGAFGFPKMGVIGAAVATVIARWLEMLYLVINTYVKSYKFTFVKGAFRTLRVPLPLVKTICITGMPLLFNEIFWSIGIAMVNMCYATRGLEAVAATNINGTVWNLFALIMMAMGNAIGIIAGQLLGANEIQRAKDSVRKVIALSVVSNLVMGCVIMLSSSLVPLIYNVEETVRQTSAQLLIISGAFLPLTSFVHCTYFTIRSGGKTWITFLFDCVFTWVVVLPLAFVLSHFTGLPIVLIYLLVQSADIIKAVIGFIMLKSGIWAQNVVGTQPKAEEAVPANS